MFDGLTFLQYKGDKGLSKENVTGCVSTDVYVILELFVFVIYDRLFNMSLTCQSSDWRCRSLPSPRHKTHQGDHSQVETHDHPGHPL